MKICILIPAYNEESRIAGRFDDLASVNKKFGNDVHYIIVDDGSTDKTGEVVRNYAKIHGNIELISNGAWSGKGGALIRGFDYASDKYKPEILGFVDADTSYSGEEIIKLINTLEASKADGVIASRYMDGSKNIGDKITIPRYIASRCYNSFVKLLFGMNYSDTQAGAKFFKGKAIARIKGHMHLSDMCFDINLLYEMKRKGMGVIEVPVTCKVINEGSNVNMGVQVPKMFVITLCYKITRTPLNNIIPDKWKGYVYSRLKNGIFITDPRVSSYKKSVAVPTEV